MGESGPSEKSKSEEQKKWGWPERIALGLAVVSLIVSGVAWKEGHDAKNEEKAIEVEAAASVDNLGSTPAGYAVRISLTNAGLRPVIVKSMELMIDGRDVAPIGGVLVGKQGGAASLGDEPLAAARPLPFALAERGAVTLTGFADFSAQVGEVHEGGGASGSLRDARAFCRDLPQEGGESTSGNGYVESDVELKINYEPEESKTIPVLISSQGLVENSWRMKVLGTMHHPDGIAFWRYVSAPSALRIITVKIWRGDGGLVRSVSLPVTGSVTTEAHFKSLPDGYYRAALLDEGHPVAIGHFDVPLRKGRPIYPLWAQLVNGQCDLLRGGTNVFRFKRKGFESPQGWAAQLRAADSGS